MAAPGLIPWVGKATIAGGPREKFRKRLKKNDNPLPQDDSALGPESKFRAGGNLTRANARD
jgi:hypothetical protein